jgi:anaerobic ribonucleoside-triphosphate reductase activating protein
MRYAGIDKCDICNGNDVGVSIFVQGCHFHCKGCFNKETWDFNGGKEWNEEIEKRFIELISKPYIKRVSILGGEPLADENLELTLHIMTLISKICEQYDREIMIWIYTGYVFENIYDIKNIHNNFPLNPVLDWMSNKTSATFDESVSKFICKATRNKILQYCDYLVDGQFEIDKQDLTYSKVKFAGSTNQRIIDIQKTLEKGEIVLYEQNS